MVEFLPQQLIMDGLSTTEQATKAAKELIQIINNSGPKTPLKTREIQLHSINKSATLFHNIQPQQTNSKLVPIKVTTVALPRVPIIVPSPRVTMTVSPLRVIEPRVPVISQGENIEYIIQIYMGERENCNSSSIVTPP